ncbi:alpha/beta fold hydrolase [Enterococcus sp. 3H8_DIV0648]|uniref:alpha/beta fold hydrolase n=1 Tax=Enterococcus sp. 3H8_DIV0648 TaxID=1834178 RepID=UPI000B6B2A67|nr:alpha/beta hydrolase [Enterococcus sp. 3H8_DIV0648]OTO19940.1 hypothetical protein A5875_001289 [Enterococcus sp. 3H8_DIV0648]
MVKKIGLIILALLVFVMVAGFFLVFLNSPGKLASLKNEKGETISGSISEKKFVEIGGIKQGMFIRGEDQSKPVLLFLHGGPGTPEFAMSEAWGTQDRLEKEFVVCYWDQRGTGMSNTKNLDSKTMTKAQAITDTIEVTNYLRKRFKQDKIYLMGHSWGAYVGIHAAEKNPELYSAYMGIGQPIHQKKGQRLAYDYLRKHAKEINDKKSVKKLAVFDPEAPSYNMLLEKYGVGIRHAGPSLTTMIKHLIFFKGYTLSAVSYTHLDVYKRQEKYGVGIRHAGPSLTTMIKHLIFFKGYTLSEKLQAFKGMVLSNEKLDTEELHI